MTSDATRLNPLSFFRLSWKARVMLQGSWGWGSRARVGTRARVRVIVREGWGYASGVMGLGV